MVKGSEESQEEEYFRGNKQNYTESKSFLDGGGVVTLESTFSDDVSSSLVHCKKEQG